MTNENYQNTKESPYMIPATILIAGVLIAGAVFYSSGNSGSPTGLSGNTIPSQPSESAVNINDVDITDEPFIGNPNAPITIAYWFDFQCPFCQQFEQQTLPALIDRHVNTGDLKVVFKDFQFLGPDSQDAGLASKAVWELYPNSHFEWQKAMFNAQDEENGGFGDLASILQLIRDEVPEVDADKIATQVEQKRSEYQQEQDADRTEGGQFGINGTPSFVIGTQVISGAQPVSVFTQVIDNELNK